MAATTIVHPTGICLAFVWSLYKPTIRKVTPAELSISDKPRSFPRRRWVTAVLLNHSSATVEECLRVTNWPHFVCLDLIPFNWRWPMEGRNTRTHLFKATDDTLISSVFMQGCLLLVRRAFIGLLNVGRSVTQVWKLFFWFKSKAKYQWKLIDCWC